MTILPMEILHYLRSYPVWRSDSILFKVYEEVAAGCTTHIQCALCHAIITTIINEAGQYVAAPVR